jgi:hypothetical protein
MDLSEFQGYGIYVLMKLYSIMFFFFLKNVDESCVYKKLDGENLSFLVLYVDDILLIRNDIGILSSIKVWLPSQFSLKI